MVSSLKKRVVSNNNILIIILSLFLFSLSSSSFAQPKAGSSITNIASGDFYDEQGNLQVINSNPVILTVQAIYSLNLQSNQQNIGTIGSQLSFPHMLTNTGNIVDKYQLSLNQLSNDQFDLENSAVYVDKDQNGEPDDKNNLLNTGTTVQLEAGETISLIVVANIPKTNVSAGNLANFTLTATSQHDNALLKTVNDVAKVVDDAVIQVTKAQNISLGKTGTEITYTFTYSNTGTAAGRLVLSDTLPTDVTYQANSAVWGNGSGNLTDADDTEIGANATIKYKYANGLAEFELASVAALSKGTVSFKVVVNSNASEKIQNTAAYQQYDTTNTILKNTTTNTVVFTVQQTMSVVLNNKATLSDSGDSTAGPDNLNTVSNAIAGGQEVIFSNYVWNTGQATDTYNLTFVKSNVPSCAVVRLYHADGRTLLTDTNGDGIIDTGALVAGTSIMIKQGVYFPYNCIYNGTMNLDVTATSVTDTTVKNSTRNQIVNVVMTGETDLYNSNNSGVGVANVSNSGQAWLTKSAAKGGTAIFPLIVKNTGTLSNNYHLYASSNDIDLNNLSTTLPAQWSVRFYEGDASCQNLLNEIFNTGNVPAGATKQYCAVVSVPTATTLSQLPIWFAVKSPLNAQGDVIKNQVDIVQYRQMTLVNDQQGRVNVGGTVVYLHTLKNVGAYTEADASGEVSLKVIPQNINDGFIYTLYYDANANGVLDSTDPIASDLYTLTGGLASQASIQLLLKVQAPTTATYGMSSAANIVVSATDTIQGLSLATIQNTDLTTVDPTQLRLTKEQVKDETCTLTNATTAVYSSTPLLIKPNQCVTYRLTIKNEGATPAENVVINDVVPAYSLLRNGLAPSISKGTVTVSSGQISGNVGVLASQEQAAMYFSIRVTP